MFRRRLGRFIRSVEKIKFFLYLASIWFLFLSGLYIYYQRSSLTDLGVLVFLVAIVTFIVRVLWSLARTGAFEGIGFLRSVSAFQLIFAFSIVLWLTISVLFIVVLHIPINALPSYSLVAAYHTITIVALYVVLTLICAAIGRAILSPWFSEVLDRDMPTFLRAMAIGVLGMTCFFYVAALFGFLNVGALIVFGVIGVLMVIKYRSELSRMLLRPRITFDLSAQGQSVSRWNTLFGCLVAAYALFIIINAAGFFSLNGDDLHTYYNVPRAYIDHARIVEFPYDASNNGAQAYAFLYAPIMLIGDHFLNYITLFFFILCILATYQLGKDFGGQEAGTRAAFFFFSMPLAFLFMLSAKVDYLLAFCILIACIQILAWMRGKGTGSLFLAAILIGFSAAIKYTALLFFPSLLVASIGFGIQERKGYPWIARACAVMVIGATLGFAPWGMRSAIVYGNPFYPYGVTGSYHSSRSNVAVQKKLMTTFYSTLLDVGHVFNPSRPWWHNVLVLVTGKSRYIANRIGPVFFGLLPLVVLVWMRKSSRSEALWSATLIGTTMLLWFAIVKIQVWYVLYIFPLWSVLLGTALNELKQRWFMPLVVIVLSLITFMHLSYDRGQLLPFYGGALTKQEFMTTFGSEALLSQYLNTEIRSMNTKYLVFPMGAQRQVLIQDNFEHLYGDNLYLMAWTPLAYSSMTDEEIRNWIIKKGITHAYLVYGDIEELRRVWCVESVDRQEACPRFDHVMQRFYDVASTWKVLRQNADWIVYQVQ